MAGTFKVGGAPLATHSDSTGLITLAHDIISSPSNYGFAQLKLISVKPSSTDKITWDTILGDTTNITKPSDNHVIRLAIAGIYFITGSFTCRDNDSERGVFFNLRQGTGATTDQYLATCADSINYVEGNDTYAGGTLTYVGNFAANTDIYFNVVSFDNNSKEVGVETHASIVLLRRTA